MKKGAMGRFLVFILSLGMIFSTAFPLGGTAWADTTNSVWTALDSIDAASETEQPAAVTMTTKNGDTYALTATTSSAGPIAKAADITDGELVIAGAANDYGWYITKTDNEGDVTYTLQNSKGDYLYLTATNNGVRVGDKPDVGGDWKITAVSAADGASLDYLNAVDSAGKTRFLGTYQGTNWRCYTESSNGSFPTNIANQTLQFWEYDRDEIEAGEVEISDISDALAATSGEFTVKGVVTMVDGRNIYIQDATGGICMYFAAAPADLAVGDTIIADGARVTYKGLPELSNGKYTKVEAEADKIELKAAAKKISDLATADVCTYVTIKELTVTEVYDNNGAYSNPNITVKDAEGNTIQIYKAVVGKTDGAWDIAVDDEIDFTGAVGINNSTLQLRNTETSEIALTEPYVEPETSTIAEALAGEAGASFTVKGVVTLVDGKNIYIQDATGGICMYFATAPADLALGDTIIADGARATYRGLPELSNGTYTKVEKASAQIKLQAAEKKISDLATADVCTYVTIKGLTVTEVYDNNGAYSNPNIKVKDAEGNTIQIYKAVVGKTDGAWDVAVDDVIDFTGAVGINNSTLQLRNTLASEIVKSGSSGPEPAGNEFGLVSTIKTGDEVILYNAASKVGVGNTIASHKITGIGLTEKDGVITTDNEAAVWKVTVNDDGTYSFAQGDNKLGGVVSGTYNNLVVTDAAYTNWTLTGPDSADFNYFMHLGDMQSSYGNVYLEYFNGFTLYGSSSPTKEAYGIQFYKKGAEPETPQGGEPGETGDLITDLSTLTDGQTVAIYSPGHKTAVSSKPNGDWYLKANAATVENGKVKDFTSDFVWKVKVNEDGTYSFYSNNDESHSITVWASGTYAELSLNVGQYPDNKWTLTPAKTAGCFYFSSPTVSGENGPAYIEAYIRNEAEVFSGYFTSPTSNKFKESEFALQLYAVNPEDAVEAVDDGEWDGVLTPGKQYVMHNVAADAVMGLYKDANYALDAVPSTVVGGKAEPGNGAYAFTVGSMGRYYSFEIGGKYLAANASEELLFVEPKEDGGVPEIAKWYLDKKDGGYIIYNKESTYNGTPVCIEYYSSVFSGWTFSPKNDINIYLFNFYEPAETTHIYKGVVQVPSAVFDCENFKYVEQDFPVTITLADLCPDITEALITYSVGDKVTAVTDYETSSDKKNYTFTIPAEKIDGTNPPSSFDLAITVTNGFGLTYSAERTVGVLDKPFFEDLTPAPGTQTGEDLKPEISVKVRNAGEDPDITLTVNDENITDFTYENGVVSYKPAEDLKQGKTTVEIKVVRKDGMSSSKTWSFIAGKSEYQLYFGQLHSHTTYSDGSGTLDNALDYIASLPESANVQFVAFTDHSNYFDTASAANPADALNDKSLMTPASRTVWETYKNTVADFNNKHSDIKAIAGFEMTWSGGPGHINTFDSDGLVSRNNSQLNNKNGDAGMKLYYETINKGDSMNQFNHPGTTFGNFKDFAYWSEETDDHMFLVEVGNGEGQIGAGGYYPSYEEYILALDNGWHLAPTNNQDNHKGLWGNANDARDVVLTNDFSEKGIYEAIRERRVYATEDKNLQITYTANGEPMGTIFEEAPETLTLDITNYDPDNIDLTDKVEVVSNGGKVVKKWDKSSDKDAIEKGVFTADITPEDSYYFVRITQADGNIAVTAPVWVGSSIKAGIEDITVSSPAIVNTDTTLTTKFFNNEGSAANIKSIVYTTDGSKVLGTDSEVHALPAGGTAEIPFTFKPDTAKRMTITATAVVEINGTEQTYTKDVVVNVRANDGPLAVTSIAEVQAQEEEGYEYAIEGVVTSNASGFDKDTAFFDCIYVQDDTAGICCFPVAGEYKIGDKVHIDGYTDFYQGEAELQVESIEVIGEGSVEPAEVTAAQINDKSVLGSLVTLKGTIESFEKVNGLIQTIMVKDDKGDVARVFIDGYITTGKDVEGCVEGAKISATGLASYDDTFNAPDGPFPRIRIRNRADVVCGDQTPTGPDAAKAAISALPENITAADEKAVTDARALYDALTDAEKEAFPEDLLAKLEIAEAKLAAAKAVENEDAVRALAANVIEAIKVKTGDFTTATVNPFKEALSKAEEVLKNPDATAAELKAANEALVSAQENLAPKLNNPMTVKAKTRTLSYSRLRKSNLTVSRKKVLVINKRRGTLSYKKLKGNAKIKINAKTGKVTVRKGIKKGVYKVKVRVSSTGNGTYKAKSVVRTFKIRVR